MFNDDGITDNIGFKGHKAKKISLLAFLDFIQINPLEVWKAESHMKCVRSKQHLKLV